MNNLQKYAAALKAMDWQYQFSDDHSKYLAGDKALRELRKMQKVIDPDGLLWLSTPGAQGHGAPYPDVRVSP